MASGGVRHHKFKLLVIGDTMTGKSALVKRYVNRAFKKENDSTIGIEYEGKTIIGYPKCEAELRLALWDTAGQRVFKNLIRGYFKSGDGVVLVVDLMRRSTFESMDYWLKETEGLMKKMTPFIVIGNKTDLIDAVGDGTAIRGAVGDGTNREISEEEMSTFVGKYANMEYIETSALTGKNVDEAFERLVLRILERLSLGEDCDKSSDFKKLEVEMRKKREGGGCCVIC